MNIKFETAKLLKPLVETENYFKHVHPSSDPSWYIFHEEVIGFDRHDGDEYQICAKDTPVLRYGLPCHPEVSFQIPYDKWDAPEQFSVQTLLREEFGIHITVSPYILSGFEDSVLRFDYRVSIESNGFINSREYEKGFETYEDSLEKALVKSLELVTTVLV